jgi:ATP/maltotriose-dependent transcriptional regulator MalT
VKQTASALVGRDKELDVLTRLLQTVRQGEPRFAQVTGEPGIGKTSLIDALAQTADADGWLVLSGRCSELERELPFALVIDTFDGYLASMNPRDFDRIAAEELSELCGLFPSLRSLAPESSDPTTAAERFRSHRAVVGMMERLAARQPLLLLLDDLHWADGASIEQAGFVLGHAPEAPIMIVGSFRSGQADPALVAAVDAAARAGAVEQIELGPLEQSDARELVGEGMDHLYEESGGNPFYLLELARIGDGRVAGLGDGDVPSTVTASIAAELQSLSPTARTLASAGAVAGDPFELDVAGATAELDDPTALAAIDELLSRDLIRPTAVPRRFQFRHPLLRSAVYESSPQGVRLAAHEKAASILAGRGAPASERAHHVVHAARHGDREAMEVLRTAGRESLGRAPKSAERWFSGALRLLPNSAEPDERLDLLMSLATASAATGHFEESHSALLEAIPLAGDDGQVPRVAAIAACAGIEQLLGHRQKAHERLTQALAELPEGDSPQAAALLVALSVDAFFGAEWDEMRGRAGEALAMAKRLEDRSLSSVAAALGGLGAGCIGPVEESMSLCDEAAALVDDLSDEELATHLDAVAWLSAAEFYLDRYEAGLAHAERGLALARATAQGDLIPGLAQALANLQFTTGHLDEAIEVLDESVDAARLHGNALALSWSLLNRSYAALLQGDLEIARGTGSEVYELTMALPGTPVAAWAGAIHAGVLAETGEPAQALEVIRERCGGEDASEIPGAWRAVLLSWVASCRLALGDADQAAKAATLAQKRAEEFGTPLGLAAGAEAGARIELASGDALEAGKRALAAAETADVAGAVMAAARCRLLAGEAFAAAGEKEVAVRELERAAQTYEDVGAIRYRDKAERELGKLGKRTHRRTRAGSADGSGVDSLTGRELEIAELVVDRKTNPEIAAELFLSVKTVESHMRNIFRKLDVSSRVDVARTLERWNPPV